MEGKKKSRRTGGRRATTSAPKMRKSCNACAKAKRRCDGNTICGLCVKRGCPCLYSERQKSGPKGCKGGRASNGASGAASSTKPTQRPTTTTVATTGVVTSNNDQLVRTAAPNNTGTQQKKRKSPFSASEPRKAHLPVSNSRSVRPPTTSTKPSSAPTAVLGAAPWCPTTKGGKAPRTLQPKAVGAGMGAGMGTAAAGPFHNPAAVYSAGMTPPSNPATPPLSMQGPSGDGMGKSIGKFSFLRPYHSPVPMFSAGTTPPSNPSTPPPSMQGPNGARMGMSIANFSLPPSTLASAITRRSTQKIAGGRRAGSRSAVVATNQAAAVGRSEALNMGAPPASSGWAGAADNFVARPEDKMHFGCGDSYESSPGGGRRGGLVGIGGVGGVGGGNQVVNTSFQGGGVYISGAFAAAANAPSANGAQGAPARGACFSGGVVEQRQQPQQWQQPISRNQMMPPHGRSSSPNVVSRHALDGDNGATESRMASFSWNGKGGSFGGGGAHRAAEISLAVSGSDGVLGCDNKKDGTVANPNSPISNWTQEAAQAGASTLLDVLADSHLAELSPSSDGGDEECVEGGGAPSSWQPQFSGASGAVGGASSAVFGNGRMSPLLARAFTADAMYAARQGQGEPSVGESWSTVDDEEEGAWLLGARQQMHLAFET